MIVVAVYRLKISRSNERKGHIAAVNEWSRIQMNDPRYRRNVMKGWRGLIF